jgi:hypothetical protein
LYSKKQIQNFMRRQKFFWIAPVFLLALLILGQVQSKKHKAIGKHHKLPNKGKFLGRKLNKDERQRTQERNCVIRAIQTFKFKDSAPPIRTNTVGRRLSSMPMGSPAKPAPKTKKCCLLNAACDCDSTSDLPKLRKWILSFYEIEKSDNLLTQHPDQIYTQACRLFFKTKSMLSPHPKTTKYSEKNKFCKMTFPPPNFPPTHASFYSKLSNPTAKNPKNPNNPKTPNPKTPPTFFHQTWQSTTFFAKYLQTTETLYKKFLKIQNPTTKDLFLLTQLHHNLWASLQWFFDTVSIQAYRVFALTDKSDFDDLSSRRLGIFVMIELYDLWEIDGDL